jgi:hypothetical protein
MFLQHTDQLAKFPGFRHYKFAVRSALPSCSIFAHLCSRTLEHHKLPLGLSFIEPKDSQEAGHDNRAWRLIAQWRHRPRWQVQA